MPVTSAAAGVSGFSLAGSTPESGLEDAAPKQKQRGHHRRLRRRMHDSAGALWSSVNCRRVAKNCVPVSKHRTYLTGFPYYQQ